MSTAPYCYATLADLRTRNKVYSTDTSDDMRLLQKLRSASRMISHYTVRDFQPVKATHYVDWVASYYVQLAGRDLLQLTSMVDGLGVAIPTSAFIPLGANDKTTGPFYAVRMDPSYALVQYLTQPERAIQVTGVWGWHDDYANAWHNTGLTLSGSLDNSSTSFTATAGTDEFGLSSALSAGMLIQIDSEWMQVVATSNSGLTASVTRGANGSTAATHSSSAPISMYQAPYDIVEIATRFAAYLAAQDDTAFGQTTITAFGTTVPAGMPADIRQALEPYRKVRVA